jgi:hypothetical protein
MDKTIKNQIRQGDVLLSPTNTDPATDPVDRDTDGSLTLAHGEVTGHRHRFVEPQVYVRPAPKARHLQIVKTTALLRHEEHTHIQVAPGKYDLPRQFEWTDANVPRAVED